jgi:hypothetical protein
MYKTILQNLTRQKKALEFLAELMREEFSHLSEANPDAVSRVEFSIQELLRQIAAERLTLQGVCKKAGATGVAQLVKTMPAQLGAPVTKLLAEIDDLQQECARQGERNAALAKGLLDQSTGLLQFIHDQVAPKKRDVYGRNARYMKNTTQQASLISGRF